MMSPTTELGWKVYFAEDYGTEHTVVEHNWIKVYIEPSYTDHVVTFFYYADSESKIRKQQLIRKYFKDSKGTFINWHGSKIYFTLGGEQQ